MMEANAETGNPTEARARLIAPAIVLVRPQLGENIGFAARAMSNFGLRDLRLVSPRDGWPNDKAHARGRGERTSIVDGSARSYDSVEEAIGDLNFVLATTARPRGDGEAGAEPRDGRGHASRARRGRRAHRRHVRGGAQRSRQRRRSSLADAILTAPVRPRLRLA